MKKKYEISSFDNNNVAKLLFVDNSIDENEGDDSMNHECDFFNNSGDTIGEKEDGEKKDAVDHPLGLPQKFPPKKSTEKLLKKKDVGYHPLGMPQKFPKKIKWKVIGKEKCSVS